MSQTLSELAYEIIPALQSGDSERIARALAQLQTFSLDSQQRRKLADELAKELSHQQIIIEGNGNVLGDNNIVTVVQNDQNAAELTKEIGQLLEAQREALTRAQFIRGLVVLGAVIIVTITIFAFVVRIPPPPTPTVDNTSLPVLPVSPSSPAGPTLTLLPSLPPTPACGLALPNAPPQLVSEETASLDIDVVGEPIRALAYDSYTDILWIGTDKGLVQFDHRPGSGWNTVEELPAGFSIAALAIGEKGLIWAGGPQGLVSVASDGAVTEVSSEDSSQTQEINALAVADDNKIWIGYWRMPGIPAELSLYDPELKSWSKWADNSEASPFIKVTSLSVENGVVWVATNTGVRRLDTTVTGGRWEKYTADPGSGVGGYALPDNDVRVVAPLADERLWIGTFAGAIILDEGQGWMPFDGAPPIPAKAGWQAVIVERDEPRWIGTNFGLWGRAERQGCPVEWGSVLDDEQIYTLAMDTGKAGTSRRWLWIGGYDGLYLWQLDPLMESQ